MKPTPANFVQIECGTFIMGTPDSEAGRFDNEVQHKVTVSAFYMSKYQVTQKEWYEVMGTTVHQQRDKAYIPLDLRGEGDNYPMYYVSWYDAIEYCNKRSIKEGLTPAYTTERLLVSAAWFVAGRGSMAVRTCVRLLGSTTTRTTGTSIWASGRCGASELCVEGR